MAKNTHVLLSKHRNLATATVTWILNRGTRGRVIAHTHGTSSMTTVYTGNEAPIMIVLSYPRYRSILMFRAVRLPDGSC